MVLRFQAPPAISTNASNGLWVKVPALSRKGRQLPLRLDKQPGNHDLVVERSTVKQAALISGDRNPFTPIPPSPSRPPLCIGCERSVSLGRGAEEGVQLRSRRACSAWTAVSPRSPAARRSGPPAGGALEGYCPLLDSGVLRHASRASEESSKTFGCGRIIRCGCCAS